MRTNRIMAIIVAAGLSLAACSSSDSSDEAKTQQTGDSDVGGATTTDKAPAETGSDDKSDDAGGQDVDDVCSLFTQADAEAAVGGGSLEISESAAGTCTYISTDPLELKMVIVQIQTDALDPATLKEIAEATAGFGGEGSVEPVDSLDDGYALSVVGIPTIMFAHGDDVVTVTVTSDDDDSSLAVALAEIIAGNL